MRSPRAPLELGPPVETDLNLIYDDTGFAYVNFTYGLPDDYNGTDKLTLPRDMMVQVSRAISAGLGDTHPIKAGEIEYYTDPLRAGLPATASSLHRPSIPHNRTGLEQYLPSTLTSAIVKMTRRAVSECHAVLSPSEVQQLKSSHSRKVEASQND